MSPSGLMLSLLGVSLLTMFLLVQRRAKAGMPSTLQCDGTGPETSWRWGAFCAGMGFYWALVYGASLLGGHLISLEPALGSRGSRLWHLALALAVGIGLMQKRRLGILALAVFCLTPPGIQAQGSSLGFADSMVWLSCNWLYYYRRWPKLRW